MFKLAVTALLLVETWCKINIQEQSLKPHRRRSKLVGSLATDEDVVQHVAQGWSSRRECLSWWAALLQMRVWYNTRHRVDPQRGNV